jgi:hypothetical protein
VTRWVFKKIAQNMTPADFSVPIFTQLLPRKKGPKSLGFFWIFRKTAQSKQSPTWAKIRPIWSQCLQVYFSEAQKMVYLNGGSVTRTVDKEVKTNKGSIF